MILLRSLAITLFTILLVGCGGGSSDGGGSSGGAVYTASGPFIAGEVSTPVNLTITVSGNTVTVTDGADSGSGQLNANGTSFIVGILIKPAQGLSCSTPFFVNGEISGNSISGTYSGNLTCSLNGSPSLTFPVTGSFSGTTTGSAKTRHSSSFADSIGSAIN